MRRFPAGRAAAEEEGFCCAVLCGGAETVDAELR